MNLIGIKHSGNNKIFHFYFPDNVPISEAEYGRKAIVETRWGLAEGYIRSAEYCDNKNDAMEITNNVGLRNVLGLVYETDINSIKISDMFLNSKYKKDDVLIRITDIIVGNKVKDIILDENNTLISGYITYLAYKQLGSNSVKVCKAFGNKRNKRAVKRYVRKQR